MTTDAIRESLAQQVSKLTAENARLRAGLELAWLLHKDNNAHLGPERMSGFDHGCISCVCAVVLGQTGDAAITIDRINERITLLQKMAT